MIAALYLAKSSVPMSALAAEIIPTGSVRWEGRNAPSPWPPATRIGLLYSCSLLTPHMTNQQVYMGIELVHVLRHTSSMRQLLSGLLHSA